MGGSYHAGTVSIPMCPHDRSRFEPCTRCDDEREVRRLEYARSVNDPSRVILDAIAGRRQWFDACSFCAPSDDALYAEMRHTPGCPWDLLVSRKAGEP